MKILLTPVEAQRRKDERLKIYEKNMTCPLCGERTRVYEHFHGRTKRKIFKKRTEVYRIYECFACGAKWEGDPTYLYDDEK